MPGKMTDKRRAALGRCSGEGSNYEPWILSHEFTGRGKKSKFQSIIFNRLRHAHSDTEAALIYFTEMATNIKDSKEHFRMDIEMTRHIASQLNVKHPKIPRTKAFKVMTIDLLLTYNDSSLLAISVKTKSDLFEKRAIEKLEIERVYCATKGIPWILFTEDEVPPFLRANIYRLRSAYFSNSDLNDFDELVSDFLAELKTLSGQDISVQNAILSISKRLRVSQTRGWDCFYKLCSKKAIVFNYYDQWFENCSLSKIVLT